MVYMCHRVTVFVIIIRNKYFVKRDIITIIEIFFSSYDLITSYYEMFQRVIRYVLSHYYFFRVGYLDKNNSNMVLRDILYVLIIKTQSLYRDGKDLGIIYTYYSFHAGTCGRTPRISFYIGANLLK